jgi:hypothetical protein
MRSRPEELHDQIMTPYEEAKLSKRELARMKFVRNHRAT